MLPLQPPEAMVMGWSSVGATCTQTFADLFLDVVSIKCNVYAVSVTPACHGSSAFFIYCVFVISLCCIHSQAF